jgi:tripartite-type tricarboxylate transporter receptor subunit TctC
MLKITKIFFSILCVVFSINTFSQSFDPTNQVIEIVVPYPPGGATDKWGRVIDEIFKDYGWKSTVLNKPGADAVIGANYVAKSKPNGQTIFVGGESLISNIAFKKKAPGVEYTENSFDPIVPLGSGTLVLVANKNIPVNNYAEFKKYIKNHPTEFNLGYWNTYTANVFYEWAKKEKLPTPNIVIYKGSAPLITDVAGKHIQFAFDTYTAMSPYVKSDKVKLLAVMDRNGLAIVKKDLPDTKVTSIGKQIPEVDISLWYGLYAPAGTPMETIAQINALVNEALHNKKYTGQIEMLHISNFGGTPAEQQQIQTKTLSIFKNVSNNVE